MSYPGYPGQGYVSSGYYFLHMSSFKMHFGCLCCFSQSTFKENKKLCLLEIAHYVKLVCGITLFVRSMWVRNRIMLNIFRHIFISTRHNLHEYAVMVIFLFCWRVVQGLPILHILTHFSNPNLSMLPPLSVTLEWAFSPLCSHLTLSIQPCLNLAEDILVKLHTHHIPLHLDLDLAEPRPIQWTLDIHPTHQAQRPQVGLIPLQWLPPVLTLPRVMHLPLEVGFPSIAVLMLLPINPHPTHIPSCPVPHQYLSAIVLSALGQLER